MSKCAWLKKLLGLNKECCCNKEKDSKVSENASESNASIDNVAVTEVKTEETIEVKVEENPVQ